MSIYLFVALMVWPLTLLVIMGVLAAILYALGCAVHGIEGFNDSIAYGRFVDDCRARGLTYQEQCDEFRAREALAKIRRTASDAVLIDPANWVERKNAAIVAVLDEVGAERPDIAKTVADAIRGLTYDHVLYEDAVAVVERTFVMPRSGGFTADERAALRIVR